jgi:predicted metal-dependent hydrolase
MADPITLSAAAIATLIATKALEKTGGTLSDKLWSQAEKFIAALRKHDRATAEAIDRAAADPQVLSSEQQAELIQKVEAAVQANPDLLQEAQTIQAAVQSQPALVMNLNKLAEKIGFLNQGQIIGSTINLNL